MWQKLSSFVEPKHFPKYPIIFRPWYNISINYSGFKTHKNSFQNLKRTMKDNDMKSLKTALEKENLTNVFYLKLQRWRQKNLIKHFPLNFAGSWSVNIESFAILDHIKANDKQKDNNIFQNSQLISDHNTIFLPILLDFEHNENSFQNLKNSMKIFKNCTWNRKLE